MKSDAERQGELFILAEAILWGLFPIITVLSYGQLSPLISLAGSTVFASLFFAVILTMQHKWHEITNTKALRDILLATLFTGIIFYLLTFFGLKYTTAGNVSILELTEVFFSYMFFHVWKKDYIPKEHLVGALCMVLGASIVLYPNLHAFHLGDLLILAAACIAPLGNYFQRRARKTVSSQSIMFIRSVVSGAFVFFVASFVRTTVQSAEIVRSLPFLLINGLVILGLSKIFWLEAIHRITVVKANALAAIAPLITLLTAWLVFHSAPTAFQVLAFIPMFFGVLLLGVKNKKETFLPQESL